MSGYTQTELDDIQAKWSLRFPPDLLALYRERRRVIDQGEQFRSFDWIEASDELIRKWLDFPFDGFWAQAKEGRYWWPEWGEMPISADDRRDKLKTIFSDVPKLIPLYGHRYMPERPHEAGNPVFSVFYTDIVCYGASLADYIAREANNAPQEWPAIKRIPFWSKTVEYNDNRFQKDGSFTFSTKTNAD